MRRRERRRSTKAVDPLAALPPLPRRFLAPIERAVLGGRFLGRAPDGRVVWLDEALQLNEMVEVEVYRARRKSLDGRRVSPSSVAPAPCPEVDRCGGCPWQRLTREEQLGGLERDIRHLLQPIFGAELPWASPWVSAQRDDLAWRSTTRLHWRAGELGFYRAKSSELIPIARCPILAPPLPQLLEALRAHLSLLPREGELRLSAARGAASGTLSLHPKELRVGEQEGFAELARRLLEGELCHGVSLMSPRGERLASWGEPLNQHASAPHPAESFMQAHQEGNEALIAEVLSACPPEPRSILDYYAGAGNFSLPLARAGHRVTAVERAPAPVAALTAQAERESLSLRAIEAGDEQLPPGDFELLVLDPPRAGAKRIISALCAAPHPTLRKLIYLSCHPAAAARDLATLAGVGWKLERARLFHLFPHSGHGELVFVLSAPD